MVLSEMQTLILWALLVRPSGGGLQKDIKPEVKRADRLALVRAGLIAVESRGRGYWLEATDKGWSWAAEHLDASLPKRSTAGNAVLQAWLTRLKVFLASGDLALADVLGAKQQAEVSPKPALDYPTLRSRIREAYFDITGAKPNTRVLLSDLRAKLKDVDRALLDEALTQMHLEQGTTLSGLNNPQALTPAIRDGVLSYKGEPMYVLWITK